MLVEQRTYTLHPGTAGQYLKLYETEGMAILFISSELSEVLRVSDRMLVLRDRKACGEYRRGELDDDSLLQVIAGEGA